jgi:pimeloyl-ACP methyl ester carboxylesterase
MGDTVATQAYTTGFVTSKDGTKIGYRQMGQGPAILLLHGGMQGSQHFMKLATLLSDEFTVYVPDRRGRGLSGPYGDAYCIQRDVEDVEALVAQTGAQWAFGLSSGAIILLKSALTLPGLRKLVIYEPPLALNGLYYPKWVTRFDQEIGEGKIAAAMITGMKDAVGDTSFFASLPRFLLVPIMNFGFKARADEFKGDDVPVPELVPTLHYDAQIISETNDALDSFKGISADVLLLGGSKSAAYLKDVLDHLSKVLPHVRRVEFPGLDHVAAENDEHPEPIAEEIRRFFRES